MKNDPSIIQGLNIIELVSDIGRKNKRNQATLLSQIEIILGSETENYLKIRKLILDSTNSYTRSIVKDIFGDIEY